ncbi:MAG: hypothetical protein DIU79_06510 [Actinobacteria bacterium]|nr:MAG: hypothetical protein DIU79_06510 [Actinomycetota bacterium]
MNAPRAGEPGAIRQRLPYLRATLSASMALMVVAAGVASLTHGAAGAAGAVAGVALVLVSYVISGVSVAWADAIHPRMVMPVGLLTYAVKMIVLGVGMATVASTGWSGLRPMGMTIIAAVFVWTGTHLVWVLRTPMPYVDIGRK